MSGGYHRRVTPLAVVLVGVALLAAGFAILRTIGPRYRVGRLLASTPTVTVAEAIEAAAMGPRYLAIRGRIDAADEFEDEFHRPLVLRRARLQRPKGRDWETIDEHVQAVDFDVREGLDAIAIDHAALDIGLIVVPRESVGTAAEIPERVPDGLDPATTVRLRVDLITAVEHAIVLGVPTARPDGAGPIITSGLGRPLVLTTLDPGEAMRVLAEDAPRRPLAAAIAFVAGGVTTTIGIAWAILAAITGTVAAASPSPGVVAGDPRSSGQGPGLVGEPVVAVALVVGIGLLSALATFAYVRLTSGDRRS